VSDLKLELAYFSGYARLNAWRTGGAGVILRFERVRLSRGDRFPAVAIRRKSRLAFWKRPGPRVAALEISTSSDGRGLPPGEPAQIGPALRLASPSMAAIGT